MHDTSLVPDFHFYLDLHRLAFSSEHSDDTVPAVEAVLDAIDGLADDRDHLAYVLHRLARVCFELGAGAGVTELAAQLRDAGHNVDMSFTEPNETQDAAE